MLNCFEYVPRNIIDTLDNIFAFIVSKFDFAVRDFNYVIEYNKAYVDEFDFCVNYREKLITGFEFIIDSTDSLEKQAEEVVTACSSYLNTVDSNASNVPYILRLSTTKNTISFDGISDLDILMEFEDIPFLGRRVRYVQRVNSMQPINLGIPVFLSKVALALDNVNIDTFRKNMSNMVIHFSTLGELIGVDYNCSNSTEYLKDTDINNLVEGLDMYHLSRGYSDILLTKGLNRFKNEMYNLRITLKFTEAGIKQKIEDIVGELKVIDDTTPTEYILNIMSVLSVIFNVVEIEDCVYVTPIRDTSAHPSTSAVLPLGNSEKEVGTAIANHMLHDNDFYIGLKLGNISIIIKGEDTEKRVTWVQLCNGRLLHIAKDNKESRIEYENMYCVSQVEEDLLPTTHLFSIQPGNLHYHNNLEGALLNRLNLHDSTKRYDMLCVVQPISYLLINEESFPSDDFKNVDGKIFTSIFPVKGNRDIKIYICKDNKNMYIIPIDNRGSYLISFNNFDDSYSLE